MVIQAFVPKLAVEALDVAVLHRSARLNEDVANPVGLCPCHESPAGELWAIVGTHRNRIATEQGRPIEKPSHIQATDAVVGRNVHALVAEIVGHGQALEAPAVGQAVAHEVHAPHLIDALGDLQRHAFVHRALRLLALAHCQFGSAVEPVHALVIHLGELRAQKVVNTPIPESAPGLGDVDDRGAQRLGVPGWHRRVTVTVAG